MSSIGRECKSKTLFIMDTFFFHVALHYFKARRFERKSKFRIRISKEKTLRRTMLSAWDNSPFYRKLWSEAGIDRNQVATLPLEAFPLVTKKQLMESYEDVVTERGITRKGVEAFIQNDPTGKEWFDKRYVAMNTSGSSGVVGVFLYTKDFWARLIGVVASRVIRVPLSDFIFGNVRVGFVGETSGHHAGISLIKAAPPALHAESIDVSLPEDALIEKLEEHRPTLLVGYTSGIAKVAELKKAGRITIEPKGIITSGEPLSEAHEKLITEAFGVRPINFYGATECLAMGASLYETGKLDIFDDLLVMESVKDDGTKANKGELGRVIITVLENDIFPLIRYCIDDEVIIDSENDAHQFTVINAISGRKMERINITLDNGQKFEIHPMDLVGMFFPGLRHYQVVQTGNKSVVLKVVVDGDHATAIKDATALIAEFLKEQYITSTDVDVRVECVEHIDSDPRTGKTPLIIALKQPA